jgi:OOP family OmpA-OmpF porin
MRKRNLIAAGLLACTGLAAAGLLDDAREAARLLKERGKKGSPAPAASAPAAAAVPAAGPAAVAAPAAPATAMAAPGAGPDEAVFSRYDFIPGDKVILFDDFSDTDVGEFPLKWHLKGPKDAGNNAVEVVEYQGQRFLRARPGAPGGDQPSATQYLRLVTKGDLPARFTIEFDAVLGHSQIPDYPNRYLVYLLANDEQWLVSEGVGVGVVSISGVEGRSANTQTALALLDGKVHHVAISVNGTFVKAYVDHQRVVNDPDAITRPLKQLGLGLAAGGRIANDRVMITNFRLAEGGKDVKAALTTDGRIVTHGILFDTGSDRLKGESLPTLKMILGLLQGDAKLRFAVEGHTDDQGGKAINQPLSERRAAAVVAWLVGKGIGAERLTAKGHGDSKPIDKNTSAEGRANNRRVEFVKF